MADLLQFVRGTSATITETFTVDGLPSDLDSGVPVVTITKPDGTTIASGTVTHVGSVGSGQYKFVLAGQAQCTILTVTWVGTIGGQPQTLVDTIEILGADLFDLTAFRSLRVANGTPFATTATPLYSTAQIMDKRTAVLQEFTDILGFSPVQRFARETIDNTGSGGVLRLENAPAGPLVSVKVAGVAQNIAGYSLHPRGLLRPVSGYLSGAAIPYGLQNVTVEYVHGAERPPGKCADMAMMYAAAMLNPSGFSSASTVSMPDGSSYTYEPSEVGRGGFQRFTGIRDIDRWLNIHRNPVQVGLGVA
jgi:hypothetical protein